MFSERWREYKGTAEAARGAEGAQRLSTERVSMWRSEPLYSGQRELHVEKRRAGEQITRGNERQTLEHGDGFPPHPARSQRLRT